MSARPPPDPQPPPEPHGPAGAQFGCLAGSGPGPAAGAARAPARHSGFARGPTWAAEISVWREVPVPAAPPRALSPAAPPFLADRGGWNTVRSAGSRSKFPDSAQSELRSAASRCLPATPTARPKATITATASTSLHTAGVITFGIPFLPVSHRLPPDQNR